jgi:bacterioferritin-associated ferredoxin
MFVCICRAVSLGRVRAAIDGGATTLDAIEAVCGAGGDCGTCRREIAALIREKRAVETSQAA